jgi:hypothetical protein
MKHSSPLEIITIAPQPANHTIKRYVSIFTAAHHWSTIEPDEGSAIYEHTKHPCNIS